MTPPVDMLDHLRRIEALLPKLLAEGPDVWQSKLIDYSPPTVERVWTQLAGFRILLHRIHPCQEFRALWHPHGWPSAMTILEGQYEMGLGFGPEPPTRLAAKVILSPGSRYEMTDPLAWHWVRPIGRPTLSLMVTGPLFEQPLQAPSTNNYPFPGLEPDVKLGIIQAFQHHYPDGDVLTAP